MKKVVDFLSKNNSLKNALESKSKESLIKNIDQLPPELKEDSVYTKNLKRKREMKDDTDRELFVGNINIDCKPNDLQIFI